MNIRGWMDAVSFFKALKFVLKVCIVGIYICVCVCVYIYIYIYIYACVCVCLCVCNELMSYVPNHCGSIVVAQRRVYCCSVSTHSRGFIDTLIETCIVSVHRGELTLEGGFLYSCIYVCTVTLHIHCFQKCI